MTLKKEENRMSESDHKREQAGHIVIREASKVAEAEHEKTRRRADLQQQAARDLALAVVSQLDGEAARYVAVRLQDATYGQVAAYRLVLEVLEDLGAKFPAGAK